MKTIQDKITEIFDKYIGQINTPLIRKKIFEELNFEIFSKKRLFIYSIFIYCKSSLIKLSLPFKKLTKLYKL